MNEQPELTVEVSEKMIETEVTFWRLAHSKTATSQEAEQACIMFIRCRRERDSRYVVRTLGCEPLKLKGSIIRQSDRRQHNYDAAV